MNCEVCGEDAACRTANVYYAEIRNVKTSQRNTLTTTQTTTTTTYGPIKNQTVSICNNCTIINLTREWRRTLLFSLIFPPLLIYFIILVVNAQKKKKDQSKISDADVFFTAKKHLKKKLKSSPGKIRYEFWFEYPTHLKKVTY